MYSKYVAGLSLSPDQALFFAMRKHWAGGKLMSVRIGAILFSLPLFSAAGGIMLPTVFTGSLALWRTSLHRTPFVSIIP